MEKLEPNALQQQIEQLGNGWQLSDSAHIEKEYKFKNFRQALEFTNKIGAIAEDHKHHPDLELGWGRVKVMITTHSAGGITASDFKLAHAISEVE